MQKWTQKEIEYLKSNYSTKKLEEICKKLNRNQNSVYGKAQQLKLKKLYRSSGCENIKILLEESSEAYYLMGLILSDGYINFNRNSIVFSNTDLNLIRYFCNKLDSNFTEQKKYYKGQKTYYQCKVSNMYYCPLVIKKFDIKPQKTYNPPIKMPKTSKNNLYSLLLGLIDGDGSISVDKRRINHYFSIKITCHVNWIEYYKNLLENLNISNSISIYKPRPNVATINFHKNEKLLDFAKNFKYKSDKWNVIFDVYEH